MNFIFFLFFVTFPVGFYFAYHIISGKRRMPSVFTIVVIMMLSILFYNMIGGNNLGDMFNPFTITEIESVEEIEPIYEEIYIHNYSTEVENISDIVGNTTIGEELFEMDMYDDILSIDDI